MSGNQDIIPHNQYKAQDTFEIQPNRSHHEGRRGSPFAKDLNIQGLNSREPSPMVIRHHQIFEENISPLVKDVIDVNYAH